MTSLAKTWTFPVWVKTETEFNTLLLSAKPSVLKGNLDVSALCFSPQLYGYCYQDSNDIKDTVTAITELGSPLEMIQLLQTPWEERLRVSHWSHITHSILCVSGAWGRIKNTWISLIKICWNKQTESVVNIIVVWLDIGAMLRTVRSKCLRPCWKIMQKIKPIKLNKQT